MLQTTWKVGLILEGHHTLCISSTSVFGSFTVGGLQCFAAKSHSFLLSPLDGLVFPSAATSVLNI